MNVPAFSIVVPAYNERAGIAAVLTRLAAYAAELQPAYEVEIVVVDDGSSDDTFEVVRCFANAHPGSIVAVAHEKNAGLVAAMRTGALAAHHETIVFLDADLSYVPEIALPLVVARAQAGAAVAVASPYMTGGYVANVPPVRLAASRGANRLLRIVSGGRFHTFTGMVRAYDRTTFLQLSRRTPVGEFNTWALATLIAGGQGVVEIPASLVWPPERYAQPSRLSLGKLWQRVLLVMETAYVLRLAVRTSKRGGEAGTFVLGSRSTSPFSTKS